MILPAATEESILRALCEEVFSGDWGALEKALEDRLRTPPHIHRLDLKIQVDLEAIKKIKES